MFFQPYAEDLTERLQVRPDGSVLEVACGTGILSRVLRNKLPPTVKLMATDLNEPMLQNAMRKFRIEEPVQWQEVDATNLPFADATYDAVICQFGLMFVPDKRAAVRETYRVLKPGGSFVFNVWDAMEHNELAKMAHEIIAGFFDRDPPRFYEVPFGYHDRGEIEKLIGQERVPRHSTHRPTEGKQDQTSGRGGPRFNRRKSGRSRDRRPRSITGSENN